MMPTTLMYIGTQDDFSEEQEYPGPTELLNFHTKNSESEAAIPTEQLLLRAPEAWVATPGCVCTSALAQMVKDVDKTPMVYAAGTGGGIPGLTAEETAILAGVLTGLATFLFLLLPILCCLCPLPCACCGFGKKKSAAFAGHRHGNMARSDNESFWSTGSWGAAGGEKLDYENLYGVDMKLPRPWVDSNGSHFDSKMHELQDGGWEGVDMTRDEIDAAVRGGNQEAEMAQTGLVTYVEQSGSGGGGSGNAMYSGVERQQGAGDEVITEYTTTRRVDMTIGGMSNDEAETYYTKTYGQDSDMTKDNFMKIYHTYRNQLDGQMD